MFGSFCHRAVLVGGLLCSTSAFADIGTCLLTPLEVNGTFGFAGSGTATAATPFAPPGPLVQSGTVTHVVTGFSGQNMSGNWNVTLTQNDSSGYHPNVQFGGYFQVSSATCQADFYVTTPLKLTTPAFHVVFVGGGTEVRTVSLIQNLFIDYASGKKL